MVGAVEEWESQAACVKLASQAKLEAKKENESAIDDELEANGRVTFCYNHLEAPELERVKEIDHARQWQIEASAR